MDTADAGAFAATAFRQIFDFICIITMVAVAAAGHTQHLSTTTTTTTITTSVTGLYYFRSTH
jgi:hypothetical protein